MPEAGMIGRSLAHRGEELLGQRGGLEAYVAERKTMGIPLLYPWANRLSANASRSRAERWTSTRSATPLRLDGTDCRCTACSARPRVARRAPGRGDAGGGVRLRRQPDLMAAFPFDHALRIDVTLDDSTLRVATTVHGGGDRVPIAFGFHPYLQLPGVPRADWYVEVPVTEQLELDDQMLPTGNRAGRDPRRPAGRADVRRRVPRAARAVRRRRRRPADRARLRDRLPVRAGVRAAG